MFKPNIGKMDRIVRIAIGLAIIVAGLIYQSWWGAIGILPIFTATIRWCPGYVPFGISTCEKDACEKRDG